MKPWPSLLLILLPAVGLGAESPPNPGTALITGSDRGIGFALVNNAGIAGNLEGQTLNHLDQDEFIRVLRVNSYGPLRISAGFLDNVAASRQRKIVAVSSGYGSLASVESIAASGYPSAYFYAMSKAALNMGMRDADSTARFTDDHGNSPASLLSEV